MALGQRLQLKLQQKLSPQQIQLMKLLQIPTANLETRIKEELEENPALEWETGEAEEVSTTVDEFSEGAEETESDSVSDIYNDIDVSEYLQDGEDEIPEYRMHASQGEIEQHVWQDASTISFYDSLRSEEHTSVLQSRQYLV